jgi:hypothetical protein
LSVFFGIEDRANRSHLSSDKIIAGDTANWINTSLIRINKDMRNPKIVVLEASQIHSAA